MPSAAESTSSSRQTAGRAEWKKAIATTETANFRRRIPYYVNVELSSQSRTKPRMVGRRHPRSDPISFQNPNGCERSWARKSSWYYLVRTLLLLVIMQLCPMRLSAAGTETTSSDSDKVQELSPRILENRFNELSDNIKIARGEIRDLQTFQQKVKTSATAVGAPKAELTESLLKSLKEAFQNLQPLKGDIDAKAEPVQKFVESFGRVDFVGIEVRRRGWDWEKQPQVIAAVGDAVKLEKTNLSEFSSQLPKMAALSAKLRSVATAGPGAGASQKWEDLKQEMTAAAEEAQKLDELYKGWIDEANKKESDYLSRLDAALQTAIQLRLDQIKQYEKEQNDIAKKLDQQKQDQHSTDKLLVYAVYAMILAIVGLFLSLHLFKEDLATAIVNERTMIELLSMGFLLLTLIILGTGRQLQETTLGTLLGTVAGYIFGRKEGEKRGAQEERKELAKMVTHAPLREQ